MSSEYEISVNTDDDFMKSFTNEIIEVLQLDEDETEIADNICRDLLVNGRSALVNYKDDIVRKIYDQVMNDDENKFMISLKKYFRRQWEVELSSSYPWFIAFLKQYEEENHDIYDSILIRTAQHGNQYMKDAPFLSVVLQLLFEGIDNVCLEETNNVFNDLWTTITNDGLQSITNYSDYIVKKVLEEQLNKQSVLFQALREYFRPNVFLSLSQCGIKDKNNLYDLALDNIVEEGWLSQMKSIENDLTPKRHRALLEKLSSFYKKTNSTSRNEHIVLTQDASSLVETSSNSCGASSMLGSAVNENTTVLNTQIDNPEQEDNQSQSSFNSMNNDVVNNNTERKYSLDAIYVSGLPNGISKEVLYQKLLVVFSTCGDIKHYAKTNGPDIWVFPQANNQSASNGTAMVRFEKEESALMAIGKYNGQFVPTLNAKISVRYFSNKTTKIKTTSNFKPLMQSVIHTKENQPNGSVSFYWDIENVAIPSGTQAYDIIFNLRKRLVEDRGLSEDTFKTYYRNIDSIQLEHRIALTHAGILTQHIESTKYGAVDYQIHNDLRRFPEHHQTPATVVLISGDIDFTNDINQLRFRNKHYVIIIHNSQAKKQLLQTANESIPWEEFTGKKDSSKFREQHTTGVLGKAQTKNKQSPMRNISKAQDRLVGTSSPKQNLSPNRALTPVSNCSSSSELNADKPDQVKKKKSKTAKMIPSVVTKLDKDEDEKSSTTITTEQNKSSAKEKNFSCTSCTRKFTTTIGLTQHELVQHKVGVLVNLVSSADGDESNTNLIVFNDTNDDGDCVQASAELNDSTEQQIESTENEKPSDANADIVQHEEDDN